MLLQVDRAYFDALRAHAILRVAEQTVAARQLVVDQVIALASTGLKSSLDLSFAHPARWAGLLHSAPLALFGDACK